MGVLLFVPVDTASFFVGLASEGDGAAGVNGWFRSSGLPSSVTGDVSRARVASSGRAAAASISLRVLFFLLASVVSALACGKSDGRRWPNAKG